MFTVCLRVSLLGLLALASAAPQHRYHSGRFRYGPSGPMSDFGGENELFETRGVFDTKNFWLSLADEMNRIDEMLNDFTKRFPSITSKEFIEGKNYIMTITLTGFEEKDIVVKAREGALMIQAVHKSEEGNEKTYIDLRTLPSYVNVAGSWTYYKDVLKIVFPVTRNTDETTEVITTEKPDTHYSREEVDNDNDNDNTNQDADVGLERGDSESILANAILTNVIPTDNAIEATTYRVDLKDEVEFVPMRF